MDTNTALRFTIGSSFGRICYYPANASAEAVVPNYPKGRRSLRPDEVVSLLIDERVIEIDLNPFIGVHYWVVLEPSSVEE